MTVTIVASEKGNFAFWIPLVRRFSILDVLVTAIVLSILPSPEENPIRPSVKMIPPRKVPRKMRVCFDSRL